MLIPFPDASAEAVPPDTGAFNMVSEAGPQSRSGFIKAGYGLTAFGSLSGDYVVYGSEIVAWYAVTGSTSAQVLILSPTQHPTTANFSGQIHALSFIGVSGGANLYRYTAIEPFADNTIYGVTIS